MLMQINKILFYLGFNIEKNTKITVTRHQRFNYNFIKKKQKQ